MKKVAQEPGDNRDHLPGLANGAVTLEKQWNPELIAGEMTHT